MSSQKKDARKKKERKEKAARARLDNQRQTTEKRVTLRLIQLAALAATLMVYAGSILNLGKHLHVKNTEGDDTLLEEDIAGAISELLDIILGEVSRDIAKEVQGHRRLRESVMNLSTKVARRIVYIEDLEEVGQVIEDYRSHLPEPSEAERAQARATLRNMQRYASVIPN